jgi:hypothetical protein
MNKSLEAGIPRVPEDHRRTEAELRAAYDAARPGILGALLNMVAQGLPSVRLDRLPRMAEYLLWVTAWGDLLNSGKAGTHAEAVAPGAAITASLLFQHGGSVETLRHAVTRKSDGSAAGPLCGRPRQMAIETGNTP